MKRTIYTSEKTEKRVKTSENMLETQNKTEFDYTYVDAIARIALYDDLKSAPRITKIEPAGTTEYIENLTVTIYEQAKLAGGKIPYSVIREVSENFIHAQFREIVVSILDDGNTIRFADQGPGIQEKEKAQKPGFSSAIEPMKDYIRGVGSGFPIVKEYLDDREGSILIEDNLTSGAVVTISLVAKPTPALSTAATPAPIPLPRFQLTDREQEFVKYLYREGEARITDMIELGYSASTASNTFKTLEEQGLVEKLPNKKRTLTPLGAQLAPTL
ncbi:MAG: histidine kinase [Eggerthellaceae bacterium]|nr:histidine kinase [Eggerthellaceae bacterium]